MSKRLFTPLEKATDEVGDDYLMKADDSLKPRSTHTDRKCSSLTGFSWFFILGVVFYSCNPVFAKTTEEELAELKSRLTALEQKLTQQEKKSADRQELAESLEKIKDVFDGLSIEGGATFLVQGTNNANGNSLSKNSEDVTDASYSIDLEFEKQIDDYGTVFIHLETGDGASVEDELQVFSSVNRDADDSDNSVSVTEVWYEYYFKTIPLTLTFGKIDPTGYVDTNEYANDECGQFLGYVFRNSPVVEFPDDNAAGVRLAIEPVDFLGIEFAAMDANADWEDAFDNMFLAGQLNFKPKLLERSGNYRVYGWLNDKDHIKWDDALKIKEKSYGFGLSFDQEITDVLGAFVRYGWQNPKSYADGSEFSLEQSWSAGIQLTGILWRRDEDIFAIAFGQVMPSGDYKKANDRKAGSEEHLETYYKFKVNNRLSVSPDLQVIWDPYGGDAVNGNKIIFVGGIRGQVNF
ncbi:carbohydrate porin [Patescibacteria group bacterium]|nr:carbohydrate porin [Patescibacteria group bacterium]